MYICRIICRIHFGCLQDAVQKELTLQQDLHLSTIINHLFQKKTHKNSLNLHGRLNLIPFILDPVLGVGFRRVRLRGFAVKFSFLEDLKVKFLRFFSNFLYKAVISWCTLKASQFFWETYHSWWFHHELTWLMFFLKLSFLWGCWLYNMVRLPIFILWGLSHISSLSVNPKTHAPPHYLAKTFMIPLNMLFEGTQATLRAS